MSSWQLLRRLFEFWGETDSPIFMQAIRQPPLWHTLLTRLTRATGVALVAGGMLCYLVTLAVFLIDNLLVLVLPALITGMVVMGLSLGPIVATERQRGTWVLVRATPQPLAHVMLGKASGALWWLRDLVRALAGVLLLVAIGIGMVTMIVTPTGGDNVTQSPLPGSLLCAGVIVIPVISATIYAVERAQQFVLVITASLLTSASAHNVRTALTAGATVALTVWLLDVTLAAGVIIVQPGYDPLASSGWLALLIFGPVIGYLAAMPLPQALLMIIGTLAGREALIRILWRYVLRRAAAI